jgi:hypothetical protein
MILPNLVVPNLINQKFDFYSPDTLLHCTDQKYFKKYPYDVTYQFNSRGFRDDEWPDDLENALWCIGDSATVGIGAPVGHSWPSRLNVMTNLPTINLGIRGLDNRTISYIAQEVITNINPKNIIILWSFFERRPAGSPGLLTDSPQSNQLILDNDLGHIEYFKQCVLPINNLSSKTNIVHGFVPHYYSEPIYDIERIWNNVRDPSWPTTLTRVDQLSDNIIRELSEVHRVYELLKIGCQWREFQNCHMKNIIDYFKIQDLARDGFHWDINTSNNISSEFKKKLIF